MFYLGPLRRRVDRKRSEKAVLGLNPNPNPEQLWGSFNRYRNKNLYNVLPWPAWMPC